ncbi:MAG: hypothetical protein ACI9U2_002261 [Bradymonadia bacterium]|jgi:hypothetical protein
MGCQGIIMESTGDMMTAYTVMHLTPYAMGTRDLDMACRISQATGNLLLSYERVIDAPPYQATITTMASAAACAETLGVDAELAGIRALKRGDSAGAADARIVEKRWRNLAASRYQRGYEALVTKYGEPGTGCSAHLSEEGTDGRRHQITYMIGLISGVQAVRHDRASGAQLGIPADNGKKIARGLDCLNADRWWQMPKALQAAIWLGLPGGTPEGVDAWAQLDNAAAMGGASGIRLAMAAQAQTYDASGKSAEVRKAIEAFVKAGRARKEGDWRGYQLLDLQAEQQMLWLSDRLWTEATGHRTPTGELGTFWDTAVAPTQGSELFDDLVDDEETPAAPVDSAVSPDTKPAKPPTK